jgi:hypothetical protein
MARTTAGLVGMVVVLIVGVAARIDAAAAPDSVVVFHVTNAAHVPADDLAEAEQVATRVYAHVGVRAVWTDDTVSAAQPDGAFHADVLLMSKEMATRKSQLDGLDDEHVFGAASRPLRRAYIFYNRIADHARLTVSNFALLLGMVIAHEVGHLLLPASSHSAAGIMCAKWQRRIARLPTFTGDQGTTIRQLLAAGSGNQS